MPDRPLAVDADGHVLEPRSTWIDYIEPAFRDRAIRIVDDDQGDEVLLIDGQPLESMRNGLACLGGIELDPADALDRTKRPRYEDGGPRGGYDPKARLSVMDDEGINVVLLYPTIGICWEGMVTEPALATAYSRAYNRYIVDFCSHDPRRLVPVAHISLLDEAGARDGVPGRLPLTGPPLTRGAGAGRPGVRPVLGDGRRSGRACRLPCHR